MFGWLLGRPLPKDRPVEPIDNRRIYRMESFRDPHKRNHLSLDYQRVLHRRISEKFSWWFVFHHHRSSRFRDLSAPHIATGVDFRVLLAIHLLEDRLVGND